jgi:tetratricopeptide (TPR) repeat protein
VFSSRNRKSQPRGNIWCVLSAPIPLGDVGHGDVEGELAVDSTENELRTAITFLEANQPKRALPLLQSHLASYPDDASAHARLAEAFIGIDEYERARTEAERALTLAPAEEHPLRLLAISYAHLGDHRRAVQIAQEAIAVAPDHWPVHHVRVSIDATAGKITQGGRDAIIPLLELAPDVAAAHLLAASHMLIGGWLSAEERAFARSHIDTALEIDPQNSFGQYLLGNLEMNSFGRSAKSFRPTFDSILSDPMDAGNRRYIVAVVNAGVRWLAVVYFALLVWIIVAFGVPQVFDYPVTSIAVGLSATVSTAVFLLVVRRNLGNRLWAFVRLVPRGGGLLMLRLHVMGCSLAVLLLSPFVSFSILIYVGIFLPPLLYFTDIAASLDTRRKVSWREQWREWTR